MELKERINEIKSRRCRELGKLSDDFLARRDPYLRFIDCPSILSRANRWSLPLYKRLYNYILASTTYTDDYNGVLLCIKSERDLIQQNRAFRSAGTKSLMSLSQSGGLSQIKSTRPDSSRGKYGLMVV
jgi:hypothetical protein